VDSSAMGRAQVDAQGRGDDGAGSEESIGFGFSLFGSIAALYSRSDAASGLKYGGRVSDRGRNFVRSSLIAAQVAFSSSWSWARVLCCEVLFCSTRWTPSSLLSK
jgi:hypothetical protein